MWKIDKHEILNDVDYPCSAGCGYRKLLWYKNKYEIEPNKHCLAAKTQYIEAIYVHICEVNI